MSFERDLRGIRDQAGGMVGTLETPSTADGYARGIKAVQGIVREQGAVMSAALENNANLWEANKALRMQVRALKEGNDSLVATCRRLEAELNRIPQETLDMVALKERNELLEAANKALKDELIREQTPELDTDQRRARLEAMKAQAREIKASGTVPSQEWIDAEPQDRAKLNPWPEEQPSQALDSDGEAGQPIQ